MTLSRSAASFLAGFLLALVGCGEGDDQASTLPENLPAHVDLVLRGEVVDVRPGRIVGLDAKRLERMRERGLDSPSRSAPDETLLEASGAIQLVEAVVRVDEVLFEHAATPEQIGPSSRTRLGLLLAFADGARWWEHP